MSDYLRVKNWSRFQHYKERRPPWIKLYNDLIGNGDDFEHLPEPEQWQLVRIWMLASKSSRFTLDENGNAVPAIPNDEPTIRRSIQTLKKIPLAKLIREGWLVAVLELALCEPEDSAVLAAGLHDASALLETEKYQRTSEDLKPNRPVGDLVRKVNGDTPETRAVRGAARVLVEAINPDHRDEGTRQVVMAYVQELGLDDFQSVLAELERRRGSIRNEAKWVNGALAKRARSSVKDVVVPAEEARSDPA